MTIARQACAHPVYVGLELRVLVVGALGYHFFLHFLADGSLRTPAHNGNVHAACGGIAGTGREQGQGSRE